ncbi:MAG: MmcB family DNA repair protein [Hyphomicrobiaceae bacterium]
MTDPKTDPQDEMAQPGLADANSALRSMVAAEIERGVTRLLMAQGIAAVSELPLPDGRRADVVGLSADGIITIVEIKSRVADFRCDQKWTAYRAYCDRLFFAVSPEFPVGILPVDTGLNLADRYGGSVVRDAPGHPIAGARRKVMMLRFGRAAAVRMARLRDPGADGMGEF